MKIIGGSFKGKKLKSINKKFRPTSSKIKEAVFNIIFDTILRTKFLDLFAGTGAVGIEALSRGAKKSIFVDYSNKSLITIKYNLKNLGLFSDYRNVIKCNIFKNLNALKIFYNYFDIIFMDPPYEKNMVYKTILNIINCNLLNKNSYLIVEHGVREKLPNNFFNLILVDQKNYSNTNLSFYKFI